MKKTAIQFALYLHTHPDKGLDQWYLMRALPEGMLALLQVASSKGKRSELAEAAVFSEDEMKKAFIYFIRLVLEGYEHSPYRGLATREKTSLDKCLLHKKLLLNIFHPDKMPLSKHPYITQQIQDSFEQVKTDFESVFANPNSDKADIIKIINKYVPDFMHIETGKHLDQKM